MFDIIHYLFEEDLMPTFPESPETKSRIRESLYEDYYKTKYRYKVRMDRGKKNKFNPANAGGVRGVGSLDNMDWDSLSEPTQETKPFIPSTDPNEAGQIPGLDAPLQ